MNRHPTMTPRTERDFYPTPPRVTHALLEWLSRNAPEFGIEPAGSWVDPAAGGGAIVSASRDFDITREAHWTAIEIDPLRHAECEEVAENPILGDALEMASWGGGSVIMNPPFSALDEFVSAALERMEPGRLVAFLAPTCWWQAEKRRGVKRPAAILPLSWRPSFKPKESARGGHKGSQDFAWSVFARARCGPTVWERLPKHPDGAWPMPAAGSGNGGAS